MVRMRTTDVPELGGAAPPITRGRGRVPAQGRERGCPTTAPVMPPADLVEDPIIEDQGEVPAAEPVPVLFDQGSTYSYVSSLFAHFLDVPYESFDTYVYVSTLVGDSVVMDRIYRSCAVTFYVYETRPDLLLLDMTDFEVILGMDWLSPYHTILD
ncbi:uncharacterized protein [Nicotiana sylvestris]|uniref:uncharacterized protein n=1 Tax=Nicotiana sylvestris TaxID=4096 RepID=UPI00388CBC87